MSVGSAAASLLVVVALSGTYGDPIFNITLPINLTSWRISLHEAVNRSLARPLSARLSSALNSTLGFLRNGSVGCTPLGEECIPEVLSCCPSTTSGQYESTEDEDLQCLFRGDVYRCSAVTDNVSIAELRLKALEYGDSAGVLDSHPWVNSWEFQSRSEGEREELQALEDEEWRKNWKPSSQENFWLKTYKMVKNEAINLWKDLRKMKKLKEVKDTLIEKKNRRLEPTIPPVVQETPVSAESPATRVLYPDELSEATDADSEERVIQFSDELPKREKKLDFKLEDIIKDAVDLASKKLKKKTKKGSRPADKESSVIPSLASEEDLLRLDEIQDTVDKLMKEVNELKDLKTEQEENVKNENEGGLNIPTGPSVDELIKKHVHNILEEKRRLYELRKIEESKRLKHEGVLKT